MPDLPDPHPSLQQVASRGVTLVSLITKYLSTLPHPIEILEELVAVISVTSSLLSTLDAAILRFHSTTRLCPKTSFVNPLSRDILTAFNQFGHKVSEAQRFKVFEPNDVGLVRVPLNGWIFIMGGDARMSQLRSRLYVEKYRVRVLIDAVSWYGLRNLGAPGRSVEQEREMDELKKMLPLLAERLSGVWRDYKLRLGGPASEVKLAPKALPAVEPKKEPIVVVKEVMKGNLKEASTFRDGELVGLHSWESTTSLASSCSTSSTSSMTIIDDSIQELWVLRQNQGGKTLTTHTSILGVPFRKVYKHTEKYYYVKPLASHPSEINDLLTKQISQGKGKGIKSPHQQILQLPQSAQWEIQKLTERRDSASSNGNIKRSFSVIGFETRARRKISPGTVAESHRSRFSRWFGRRDQGPMEWVLVLRGETIDRLARTTPSKREDPWKSKEKGNPEPTVVQPRQQPAVQRPSRRTCNDPMPQPPTAVPVTRPPVPGTHVLRHVEQRRGMSMEQAETQMESIMKRFIKFETEEKEEKEKQGADIDCANSS